MKENKLIGFGTDHYVFNVSFKKLFPSLKGKCHERKDYKFLACSITNSGSKTNPFKPAPI